MRVSSIVLFLFAVSSLITSCGSRENAILSDSTSFGSEPRVINGVAEKLIVSLDFSDSSIFVIEYAFFTRQNSSQVMDSSYKDSVNRIIFNNVRSDTHLDGEFEPLTESFFSSRLDSLVMSFHEEEDEYTGVWGMEMSIGIQDFPSFVELTLSGWSYTGGAHGNGYVTYHLIDREDGRQLELKDVFTDLDALNAIAEPYFRALFELDRTESLNDYGFWFDNDEFTVNENFTFIGGSVQFYYNSYEIAPYSGGPTELVIPMDTIKHLLKLKL